jgi:hypothetical protein
VTGVPGCLSRLATATLVASAVAGCGQIGTATFTPFDVAAGLVRPESERFAVGALAFSPDSKSLFFAHSDNSSDSQDGAAKLDLATFAITGIAPGFCGEGIRGVSFSPDGAHMVGVGKLATGDKDLLFSRSEATGELNVISDSAPLAYMFSQDGRLVYLVQKIGPAAATHRSPTGTFIRAYDLQARTYVDPQTLKPAPAPWSGQLLLKPNSPDNLRLYGTGAFGVEPDGRHILFFAATYSAHPSLADIQEIFAAKKQRIGINDLFLLRFDFVSQTISAHPLNGMILSDPALASRSSLPRVSVGRITPGGDIYFSVQGIPKIFRFENGSISPVDDLSKAADFKTAFQLSPDRRWVAYSYDGPHDSSRGYNRELALFDADKNEVVFTVSKKTMQKSVCSSKTGS